MEYGHGCRGLQLPATTAAIIMNNHQGKCFTAECALEFRTLAPGSRWNEPAMKAAFHQGLNVKMLKELVCCEDKVSLH